MHRVHMHPNANARNQHRDPRRGRRGRSTVSAPDLLTVANEEATLPLAWQRDEPEQPAVPLGPPTLDMPLTPESVGNLARAVAEVGFGVRAASHLHRWVTRPQLELLQAHGAAVRRHPSSSRGADPRRWHQVRAIRIQPVSPTVVEVCAVLVGGRRSCAVAMRLELAKHQWVATSVRLA